MGYRDEQLFIILQQKVEKENENKGLPSGKQNNPEYITGIIKICDFGVQRAVTIRDSFPMYTLLDETHICNVMQQMIFLLGNTVDNLTCDETAMLILAACCHDIGMSYNEGDREELFADPDRLNKYLDNHKSEYVKAYAHGGDKPQMTDDMIQNYLRSIHHERIGELLSNFEWPSVLEGRINRQKLITVCQSHGNDISVLDEMEETNIMDLRFCAVLLRLSDILDFDTSRAPKAVYDYSGFGKKESASNLKSKEEWDKHLSSHGFDFTNITDRSYPYNLNYGATCKSMQVEQTIHSYLDWVDQELSDCNKQIRHFTRKWQEFILPQKIKRNINAEGYLSGQYRLTLDQDQIMELLVGRDLYSDPSVFVRELIQNAIDAVRTREQLDKNLPSDWKPQIKIRSWMDEEGYHWFRIEDNGIGMTEEVIMNFFLKIGSSYYTSDTFQQEKIRCKADPNYMPISRFGIGILSCFMGDERTNRVEVSTKRFNQYRNYYPALRLSMNGMNGYYYLASKDRNHMPGSMIGVTEKEREKYLQQAGTVIAVRTNLYQTGKYRSFKEIIDKYVIYPPVPIHYDGAEGSFDYPTESEFMDAIHHIAPSEDKNKNGVMEFLISDEQLNEIYHERPEISFKEKPKVLLNCISIDQCTKSPYLSGAVLTAIAMGEHDKITIKVGEDTEIVKVGVRIKVFDDEVILNISLAFSNEYGDRMSAIKNKLEYIENTKGFHELTDFYHNDGLRNEIVHTIYGNLLNDDEWKTSMLKKFEVTIDILNNAISEVKQKYKEINGVALPTQQEINAFNSSEKMNKSWGCSVCKLTQFDWYKKFFMENQIKYGECHVTAHNGILCGDALCNYYPSYFESDEYSLGSVLLLKDKYRPRVDISRNGIRMLPLEALIDLEIIKMQIIDLEFNVVADYSQFDEANFSYLPMSNYLNILRERSDFTEQLVFYVAGHKYSYEELQNKILGNEKVWIQEMPCLSNHTWYHRKNSDLYKYICASYLRKEYLLRISFEDYAAKIYITNEKYDIPENYIDILPATFFLLPLNEDCSYLTSESAVSRYSCNACHPFSRFVLKNCHILKQQVPGIFHEILKSLAEDRSDKLVRNINDMLDHLRSLPGALIEVPNDLKITEEELYPDKKEA